MRLYLLQKMNDYIYQKMNENGGKPPAVPMSHESFSHSGLTELL